MFHLFYLYLCCIALTFSVTAQAGSHSHGADFFDRDGDNIWLLGPEAVPFCIEAAADFGQTPQQLHQIVEESLASWRAFFTAQGLASATFQHPDVQGRGLALSWAYQAKCTGVSDEILFAFGTTPPKVKPFLDGANFNGLGMAIRGTYDNTSYRNGGLIWIAKASGWDKRNALKHLVMHELGHVFGMPHGSVHVMDEKVAQRIFTTWHAGQVESPNWPYDVSTSKGVELSDEGPSKTQCAWMKDGTWRRGMFASQALPFFGDLGLQHNDCIAVTLRSAPRTNGDQSAWYLDVENLQTGVSITLTGKAKPQTNEHGPSLYLRIIRTGIDTRLPSHNLQSLQTRSFAIPAQGSLTLPNGKTVGVTVSFNDGPKLEVFLPETGIWWSRTFVRERTNLINDLTYFSALKPEK